MIYENPYWYDIVPSHPEKRQAITGKWLFFDETSNIHALIPKLVYLVENTIIRSAKVARKLPEYDPFPNKPCVLCVFTSSDPDEKNEVKEILKRNLNISVSVWKSDWQTRQDWNEGGWLRIEADINQIRRDIQNGSTDDIKTAKEKIKELEEQLTQVIHSIDDPNQQLEIQINRFSELKKKFDSTQVKRGYDGAVETTENTLLERLSNLEHLIRGLETQKVNPPSFPNIDSAEKQIKILFLAANALDTTRLRLDAEIREIENTLRKAQFRDKFDIRQQWAVRVTDLQSYLLYHKPDIVHFSGHGSPSSEIILEDSTGRSHPVPPAALSKLFSILKENIKCVILNACYSEEQAQAVAKHIDCVIGMSQAINDTAAISFSTAFYQALAYGKSIKTAFELGCVQIELEAFDDFQTPKLIATSADPSCITFATYNKHE